MSQQTEQISEDDLSKAFAQSYKFVHSHLQEGFIRADGQSVGLTPKWNSLLLVFRLLPLLICIKLLTILMHPSSLFFRVLTTVVAIVLEI